MGNGSDILEVGSNAFELIEFTVTRPRGPDEPAGTNTPKKPIVYGVNVAKVREVIRLPEILPCLTTCPEVRGLCNLRGSPVPVIHLAMALGYGDEAIAPSSQMIVTEFSGRVSGFVVNATRRIRRVGWDKILPPTSDAFRSITGMLAIENGDFLFMLDFEQIMQTIDSKSGRDIAGDLLGTTSGRPLETVPAATGKGGQQRTVMVVDDSPVARKAISNILRAVGFRVLEFSDGEAAWDALSDPLLLRDMGGQLDAVISDVEMPRLDGYSLVKRVRADKVLASMPVILHSSLTGEVNRERAKLVGANAYVQKFNKKEILDALHDVFGSSMSQKDAS